MPTRASDSSKFTRWDQDSLRGGNLTHLGIVENGVLAMAAPRTNLGGATSRREPDFGSGGRGFESLRARHFSTGCPSPILAEASNASFSEWRRRRQPMCQMPSPSARIVRCSPRPN
jgi:hypothetical protein